MSTLSTPNNPCSTLVCIGGTSNKSSSDFVHLHELGCTRAILIRKCHSMCSLLGLPTSGLFSLGRSCNSSLSWGPTVFIAFWIKLCPVDFNGDYVACLIVLPCTTSPAIFNPVLKPHVLVSLLPFFNKGMAALKSPPRILPSPCPH